MRKPAEIDVRHIPTPMRHDLIFARFDDLSDGEELRLLVDHEPRPLRMQFSDLRSRQFMWMQRFCGNELWEVKIRRIVAFAHSDDVNAFLLGSPLTSELSDATRRSLADNAIEVAVDRNAAIVEQGQEWPYLGLVRSGIVSAILTSSFGREQTIYEILPTEAFNEAAVLDGGATSVRFVASTKNVRVLLLPVPAVESALSGTPMLRRIGLCVAQRHRTVIERFTAQVSLPIVSRVAQTLLAYAQPTEGLSAVLTPLDVMTQVQLATAAGTVKEVLSRALAELEAARAIQRKRGRITQLDRAVLSKIAHSS